MKVDKDLKELLASFEGDSDIVRPNRPTASNPPNPASRISATILQSPRSRTSPSTTEPDQPLVSSASQRAEGLPRLIPHYATIGMLPSSLPLPVALPPPVDGKGPRQGQPEESIRAKAACSSIIRLGDKRLAISGSAEEYSGAVAISQIA
jgi:hypothetical protein